MVPEEKIFEKVNHGQMVAGATVIHFFVRKKALVANVICLWKPTLNKVSCILYTICSPMSLRLKWANKIIEVNESLHEILVLITLETTQGSQMSLCKKESLARAVISHT